MNKSLSLCAECIFIGLLAVGSVHGANGGADGMKARDTAPMAKTGLAGGVVHELPQDLRDKLVADVEASRQWESLTPLARNEWICWVEDAKKSETRIARIARVCDELKSGKRRPCCWPGCSHREKSGK